MIFAIVLVALVVIIGALMAWGALTAATAFTLAVSNVVLQLAVIALALALGAAFIALWRIGALRAQADAARAPMMLGDGKPSAQDEMPMLIYPRRGTLARRATHRARAARLAQRWFR